MPIILIRDLPEERSIQLKQPASDENRSIAQQVKVLLGAGLGLHGTPPIRRKALLGTLSQTVYPQAAAVDDVALIRGDRER